MITLLTIFLVVLSLILAGFIYIQQGKGDMGLGSIGGGSQMLFGGSGGQDFLQKATWTLGAIFMLSCLGLAILKTTHTETSLKRFRAPAQTQPAQKMPSAADKS